MLRYLVDTPPERGQERLQPRMVGVEVLYVADALDRAPAPPLICTRALPLPLEKLQS